MQITPSIPLKILRITSPETEKGSIGERTPGIDLRVGQFLKATVLSTSEEGLLQLRTDGGTITARSEVRFSTGSEVWLEVHEDGDPPLMSVATRKMAVLDLLKHFFANTSKMREALLDIGEITGNDLQGKGLTGEVPKNLGALLTGSAQGPASDPGKILTMIRLLSLGSKDLGSDAFDELFEETTKTLPDKVLGRDNLDGLVKIGRLLEIIRSININTSGNESLDFSLFPCFFSSSSGWGQWMFSAEKDTNSTRKGSAYILDFFLDMSRLGEIYISAQVGSGFIRCSLKVEGKEVKDFLTTQTSELKKFFIAQGYRDVSISCQVVDRELRQILKDTIEQRGRYKDVSLVDVKV